MQTLFTIIFYCFMVSLPVGASLFKVWLQHDTVALGYQLSAEEQRHRKIQSLLREFEIELAAEKTPARLHHLAHNLGLQAPKPQQILGYNQLATAKALRAKAVFANSSVKTSPRTP